MRGNNDSGMHNKPGAAKGLRELCKYVRNEVGADISVIEIGSYMGDSASIFLEYFKDVTCVDPWSPEPEYSASLTKVRSSEWWSKTERVFDQRAPGANKIKATGDEAAKWVGKYGLVYLDAVHTYEAVVNDIRVWLDHAEYFIGGHDYAEPLHPGVKQAVNELLGPPVATFIDTSWLHKVESA